MKIRPLEETSASVRIRSLNEDHSPTTMIPVYSLALEYPENDYQDNDYPEDDYPEDDYPEDHNPDDQEPSVTR
jgi:hypothetical protein